MNNRKSKTIVLCALGMATVFVLTAFVALPIGQFGYVNLGDCGVMLFSSFLSPGFAFLCSGIGSALSDFYLGYSQYAFFSLFIKGLEGVLIAYGFAHCKGKLRYLFYALGILTMTLGYYLYDAFLTASFIVALSGIGFNFMQGVVSAICTTLLHPVLSHFVPKDH